jgi:hypothetical protein
MQVNYEVIIRAEAQEIANKIYSSRTFTNL